MIYRLHNSVATALSIVFLSLLSQGGRAQILSVDVNGTVRSDVTAPGFTAWYMAADLTGTKRTVSRTFTNYVYTYDADTGLPIGTNVADVIPCTVTETYPTAADATIYLNANYANKNGNTTSTDPNAGWRLSADGCWAHQKDDTITVDRPYTNGGSISLTISNLSAGLHTITTYHNDLWGSSTTWHGNNAMSRCIISANGVPVFTNTPTVVSTNDSKCGFAFFTISNSFDGQPLVLDFTPDHSSQLDFVILNGFEIDRPSAPGTSASAVFPVPGDEHVFANNDVPLPGTANVGYLTLQWQPAGFAVSNYVYFGTSIDAVGNATTASPEFKIASAAIIATTNTYNVSNLNSALTYYWRVDQFNIANGATNLVKGAVWKFRTRHLAFPTAEGYGRFSRGGRGGRVIEVTNLNDSGPGSYRAAVQASGPRTVVFRVSGLVRLNSPCVVGNGNDYLTIAGQTAPGEGICLANWRAGLSSCTDINMRFIRCRLGDASKQAMDGIGLGNSTHSIIDHCSISWTMDEASSSRQSGAVGSSSCNITFQYNIISEPLQHSYHYDDAQRAATGCTNCYQAHAFAASISGEIGSYHHNLIAHSTDRNWSLAGGLDQSQHYAGSLDIRNNVVYNWTARTTDGGVERCNYVNNYYKSYSTSPSAKYLLKLDTLVPAWGVEFYYMTGNVMVGVSGQANLYTNNWANGGFQNGSTVEAQVRTNSEIFPSYVATQTASNAYKTVISDVGCNLPIPDVIDRRIIGEVLDRTTHYIGTNGNPYVIDGVTQPSSANYPGIIDKPTDVSDASGSPNFPWPPYATYNVPADADHDGLPDWWETIKGLNPNSPANDFSDSNGDPDGDGYTNLEDYLQWLAARHFDCTNGTPLDIDLTQLTRGFTNNSPTYAFLSPTNNGTLTLVSGNIAHFTSTVSTNALGSFTFKVTDSQGTSMTNTVGIHIVATNGVVNTAPVLAAVSNRTINVGVNLSITNSATDAEGNTLTYTLPVAPAAATIGASNGVLTWRPLVTQGGTTNQFTVTATDNGSPNLSASTNFTVIVNPLTKPQISTPNLSSTQVTFSVSGQLGPDYGWETSTNLASWSLVFVTNSPPVPFTWTDTNVNSGDYRFYRVKAGPPLP